MPDNDESLGEQQTYEVWVISPRSVAVRIPLCRISVA